MSSVKPEPDVQEQRPVTASTMVTRVVEQVVPAVVDSVELDALLAGIDVDALLDASMSTR